MIIKPPARPAGTSKDAAFKTHPPDCINLFGALFVSLDVCTLVAEGVESPDLSKDSFLLVSSPLSSEWLQHEEEY